LGPGVWGKVVIGSHCPPPPENFIDLSNFRYFCYAAKCATCHRQPRPDGPRPEQLRIPSQAAPEAEGGGRLLPGPAEGGTFLVVQQRPAAAPAGPRGGADTSVAGLPSVGEAAEVAAGRELRTSGPI
jgi:hypothetical protein